MRTSRRNPSLGLHSPFRSLQPVIYTGSRLKENECKDIGFGSRYRNDENPRVKGGRAKVQSSLYVDSKTARLKQKRVAFSTISSFLR